MKTNLINPASWGDFTAPTAGLKVGGAKLDLQKVSTATEAMPESTRATSAPRDPVDRPCWPRLGVLRLADRDRPTPIPPSPAPSSPGKASALPSVSGERRHPAELSMAVQRNEHHRCHQPQSGHHPSPIDQRWRSYRLGVTDSTGTTTSQVARVMVRKWPQPPPVPASPSSPDWTRTCRPFC